MAAGLAGMRMLTREAYDRLDDLGTKLRSSLDDCFRQAGVSGRVTGMGSLFRLHAVDRELTDYRSTRTTPAEGERLVRLVRRLMEHGVLMSVTGLGCLSTPMGDAELEGLVETFAAVLEMERAG
jgi:glutamate-1-semialdehyde 2,1-aminomutase